MTTKTEQILDAIKAALVTRIDTVERNSVVPNEVPASGLVIVRDGTPGEPERLLGGFEAAYYTHDVEIEVFVQKGNDAQRDAAFDSLLTLIKSALYADKTFGGLAYGLETSMPEVTTLPVEGAPPIKAGTIILRVEYDMQSPLG